MSANYFTFGSEHTMPDGTPAGEEYVVVDGPAWIDHRSIFMDWLKHSHGARCIHRSNFSSQYGADMWERDIARYYGPKPWTTIVVTEAREHRTMNVARITEEMMLEMKEYTCGARVIRKDGAWMWIEIDKTLPYAQIMMEDR